MTLAVCDQEAFYPFRSLVNGQVSSLSELASAERFVRTVVLHDEIVMELEPWPYDAESDPGFSDEEKLAGARNVMVAIGPVLDGFDFFSDRTRSDQARSVELSPPLIQAARDFSRDEPGNPYYNAHIEYLHRLVSVVTSGGSALVSGKFGRTAIDRAADYPEKLFETLDADWQTFARKAGEGDVGVTAPPLLSILLTRAARRDALPTVLSDMRDEFAYARAKIWHLLDELKSARTIGDAEGIKRELASASQRMSPATTTSSMGPGRVLWNLIGSALGGGGAALLTHTNPVIGGAIGAVKGLGATLPLDREFGHSLFRHGAFDLARRVRGEVVKVEFEALARHLSKSELRRLEQSPGRK